MRVKTEQLLLFPCVRVPVLTDLSLTRRPEIPPLQLHFALIHATLYLSSSHTLMAPAGFVGLSEGLCEGQDQVFFFSK